VRNDINKNKYIKNNHKYVKSNNPYTKNNENIIYPTKVILKKKSHFNDNNLIPEESVVPILMQI
jgi:hypothetical protein